MTSSPTKKTPLWAIGLIIAVVIIGGYIAYDRLGRDTTASPVAMSDPNSSDSALIQNTNGTSTQSNSGINVEPVSNDNGTETAIEDSAAPTNEQSNAVVQAEAEDGSASEPDTNDYETAILSDMQQIKTALILYSDDYQMQYPLLDECAIDADGCLGEYIVDEYLMRVPTNPSPGGEYYYCSKEVVNQYGRTDSLYAVWGTLRSDNGATEIIGHYLPGGLGPYYKDLPRDATDPCALIGSRDF